MINIQQFKINNNFNINHSNKNQLIRTVHLIHNYLKINKQMKIIFNKLTIQNFLCKKQIIQIKQIHLKLIMKKYTLKIKITHLKRIAKGITSTLLMKQMKKIIPNLQNTHKQSLIQINIVINLQKQRIHKVVLLDLREVKK
ncbi:hypothetical protein TTHERM_000038989 (macronuclear) [Tetrahymena thermophila SB210]|uniref:Uncharacterized protein n=1 Tax=Tetrahymena thermophila (strain SB210) TaxID=312017 RepID=W7XIT8_TETTS|nr:hypothetical protein TTHERM_000038989 [Tetrahymena thermophila SB210]EWS74906.1 hypothetical protein TTHERM_000038989 [Tetrahymena thermophila SB210]|eukprot:XP_012652619.1 hypothetical protein TTHERM_000038989 [Tetrahymena thermophila SB210]